MNYNTASTSHCLNKVKTVLLSLFLLTTTQVATAQNVVWANATICTNNNYSLQNICTDHVGDNYTVGRFAKTVDFDESAGVDTIKANSIVANAGWAGFISKSDNNGNHLWAKAIIPYASNAQCTVFDVTVDNNNNVVVTGIFNKTIDFDPGLGIDSLNSSGVKGSFIMKLDAAGNFIWAKTFINPDIIMWSVNADQGGNVVVSGTFDNTCDFDPGPAVFNMTTIYGTLFALKMDLNGNFLWAKSWYYSNMGSAQKSNLDIDFADNIYVCGKILFDSVDLDPGPGVVPDSGSTFLVKLDPTGNFIWGHGMEDSHCLLSLSKYGYLLLSGTPYGFVNNAFIAKYDLTGTALWSKILPDSVVPGQYFNGKPLDFTEDTLGNVYVAGNVSFKSFLYKTDSSGHFLWRKIDNSSATDKLCVKVNISNELMVGGEMANVTDVDFGPGVDTIGVAGDPAFFLMKYNYCGNNYTFNYNGCDSIVLVDTTYLQSTNYLAEYLDLANCDSNVFIHVALITLPDVLINACDTALYNGQAYTQTGVYTQVVPNAFGCDSVVTVTVNINTPANQPPFLNLIQTFQPYHPPGPGYINSTSYTIEVDSLYNMYIGGEFTALTDFNPLGLPYIDSSFDAYAVPAAFVTRYDSAGLLTWMHKMDTQLPYGMEVAKSLSLNDNLDLYSSTVGGDWGPYNYCWVNQFQFANNYFGDDNTGATSSNIMYHILNDPTSNAMVKIGYLDSTYGINSSKKRLAICKVNGNDSVIFSSGGDYMGYRGTMDAQGNVFVSGNIQDVLNGTPYCFIAKLDSNLNMLWNKKIAIGEYTFDGNAGPAGMRINTLKVDTNGTLLLCGYFMDTIDIDISPNTYNLISNGGADAFIARFDTSANLIWAHAFGGTGDDEASSLVTDLSGKIFLGGTFTSQSIDLDPSLGNAFFMKNCANASWQGGYISKFKPDGTFMKGMGSGTTITDLEFKAPKRIYATGIPFVQVFELDYDTIVNNNVDICIGDSIMVGNNMYNQSGIYMDTFLTALGSDSIIITTLNVNPLPVVVANASDTTLCAGDSVILFGTGGISYTWNNMVMDSVAFSPIVTNTYFVTGTDINGCTNQDSITVFVNLLPVVVANASDTVLCFGDSVILFGSGAVSFTWNNFVIDSMVFSPNITNNYLVTGTDTNGCVNSDSITVVVNALPNVVANASDTSVCVGNPVTLYGTGADSFSWTNSVIDSVAFYPIDTAMYVVTGIDLNGCVGQDSIEVITYQIPFPILVFSGDTLYCTNVTGVNIYWYKDTVAIDSLVNYYVVTQNGNYEVFVVDSNGCAGADSISMLNIGFLSHSKSDIIQVYPNPTNQLLNISFDMNKTGEVDLIINDLMGNNIYSSKRKVSALGKQLLKIDLSQNNLTTGIYFLNIIIDGKRHVVKFEYRK